MLRASTAAASSSRGGLSTLPASHFSIPSDAPSVGISLTRSHPVGLGADVSVSDTTVAIWRTDAQGYTVERSRADFYGFMLLEFVI